MKSTETTSKSRPYHTAFETAVKAILIDSKAPHKYFQLIGITRLAAIASIPAPHRDDAKMFWKNVQKDVKKGSPGSSVLVAEIDKVIDAIEAQKLETANGAGYGHPQPMGTKPTAQPQMQQHAGAGMNQRS